MHRRTKVALLVGSLAVVTAGVTYVVLSLSLFRALDRLQLCETGFSTFVSCTSRWSTTTTSRRSTPIPDTASIATGDTGSTTQDIRQPISVSVLSWSVAHCPRNEIARQLLCIVPAHGAPTQAASQDTVTGMPLPKPWYVRTVKSSPLIKSVHVETPLDLVATLRFYRVELNKRGWMEDDGAIVAPDRAVVAYTTTEGPAVLRLVRQNGTTIADLSQRLPAVGDAGIRPKPGQAKLMIGNATDEAAVMTVNEQTITLAARAGDGVASATDPASKLPDGQNIDLPPGRYKVALKIANGTAQNREFEIAADETWALMVGPAGVPLPVHLY